MKTISLTFGLAAAQSLALIGCAADTTSMESNIEGPGAPLTAAERPGDDAEVVEAEERVLHQFDAGGDEIRISQFIGDDGQVALMVRDEGSAYRPLLVDRLFEAEGELTTLEIFRALAPVNSEPETALIEAHADQAVAMGRQDAAIREVNFDLEVPITKISPTACSDIALPPSFEWQLIGHRIGVSGFNYACLANNCSTMTTKYTRAYVCNDSSGTVKGRNAYDFNSSNPWQVTPWTTVGVESYVGWFMNSGSSRRYSADGDSISGRTYHLYSGALK